MLDINFIREHLDEVKANCRNRNAQAGVDGVIRLDDERKRLVQDAQTLQQRANEVAKQTGKEKDPAKKQALIEEGRKLREQVAAVEAQRKQAEEQRDRLLRLIPNMSHPDAPVGTTAADNKVIKRWGEPRKFDFKPKDHV